MSEHATPDEDTDWDILEQERDTHRHGTETRPAHRPDAAGTATETEYDRQDQDTNETRLAQRPEH